jgi:hypothetical protein
MHPGRLILKSKRVGRVIPDRNGPRTRSSLDLPFFESFFFDPKGQICSALGWGVFCDHYEFVYQNLSSKGSFATHLG